MKKILLSILAVVFAGYLQASVVVNNQFAISIPAGQITSSSSQVKNSSSLGSVVVNNPLALSIPAYSSGGGGSTLITATSPIVATPITGGYNISTTLTTNPYVISQYVELLNAPTTQTLTLGAVSMHRLSFGVPDPYTLVLPDTAPIGAVLKFYNLGTAKTIITTSNPSTYQIIINDQPFGSVQPLYANGNSITYGVTFTRTGSSSWRMALDMPFIGAINAS